ncbi:septum formation inhibitor Maf [Enterovibrio norvegicus]|uniref:dTTP/UTP pyrophosphatase n=1 Tax=Enterovibrio norvegicus DSM 15893 TaxID=1121869 RepID=A0A1I5QZZ6_9GAMM|nr:Maf family protein [Enterovibrio norvegicus]MCC4799523.1 Maf-like protein [Enterovibrio norvegicus]OEE51863.1 septum formation inhibitor Maf [Enterovibrio norvegicus]PMH64866.1 septum formation inhibitor Maf [Enterovibrio norvegicus]PMI36771.1 septum formation inhibitor Maf [Enterovibrio norvegicus]PMN50236.1 septum formation inhibitor Maf [Enterovibrio norvegicus]
MSALHVYLASASPRRKELLEQLSVSFSILRVDVEEQRQPHEEAADYVRRLSIDKAKAGVDAAPTDLPVLGADTIVVCDGTVLEKPQNLDDSRRMLRQLSDRQHQVMTAVTFADRNQTLTTLVTTHVWFKALSDEEITAYWQSGEPADKAGSYGIQGLGGRFVTRIDGSYHAVVGLPLFETDALLTEFKKLRGEKL